MKMLISAFAFMLLIICGGCSDNDASLPPVKPTQIISESEAEAAVGGEVDFVLEHEAVVEAGDNVYVASYVSEKQGETDPVIIEVMYPTESVQAGDIKKVYTDSFDARVNKRRIEGVGEEAFVAFPTLSIYENGHLIKITAGSGDTRQQLDALLSLGQTAVENLNNYINSNKK